MTIPHPNLVAHCDWSTSPAKRWMVVATLSSGGDYRVEAPQQVGPASSLLSNLRQIAGAKGSILIGFDFPIGLPSAYAKQCGFTNFSSLLPELGQGEWVDFYRVAAAPEEISLKRPFYPLRPGSARQSHLLQGLRVSTMDDLRRKCDLGHEARRPAAPIFWTMGGQQVGKAAISGWQQVVAPAIQSPGSNTSLWPFNGRLEQLVCPGATVLAETYPGEFYHHLNLCLRDGAQPDLAGKLRWGKRSPSSRAAQKEILFSWAENHGVSFSPVLCEQIVRGFGASGNGEDAFDTLIGLVGMLNIACGDRPTGEPEAVDWLMVEGWILGQIYREE